MIMNILFSIRKSIIDLAGFIFQWWGFVAKFLVGIVTIIVTLIWVLIQLVVMISNFIAWVGENVFSIAISSPIQAAFPSGMEQSVDLANAIFPVEESFDAFSFLAALWLLVATVRVIKGLTVSILGN